MGPVDLAAVRALLRSKTKPEGAQKVFGDVYLVSSKPLLEKALSEGKDSSALHVYLGYAGWGAGQLEAEVKIGAWYIFRGDAEAVFASDPDSVWLRLFRRRELQIARASLFTKWMAKNPKDKDLVLSALARSEKGFRDEEWRRFLDDMPVGMAVGRFPYTTERKLQRPLLFRPLMLEAPEPTDAEIAATLGRISL